MCITHAVLHVRPDPLESARLPDSAVNAQPARFGFIVSKAVGGAVIRNRVRRRLKAIVERRLERGFCDADVVFRVLPAAAQATFAQLEHEVTRALDRVDRLRLADTASGQR